MLPPQLTAGQWQRFLPLAVPSLLLSVAASSTAANGQTPKQGTAQNVTEVLCAPAPQQESCAAAVSPMCWCAGAHLLAGDTLLLPSRAPEGGIKPRRCVPQSPRAGVQQQGTVFGKPPLHKQQQCGRQSPVLTTSPRERESGHPRSHLPPCGEGMVLSPPGPGRNRTVLARAPSWPWRDLLLLPSSHGEGVDVVDLIGEVLLALLGQEVQPSSADDLPDHIQVPADAAVHIVHDDSLLSHVVLDDNNAVGPQAGTAPLQEVREVAVGEMAWRGRAVVRGHRVTRAGGEGRKTGRLWLGSLLIQAAEYGSHLQVKALAWGCPTSVPLSNSIELKPLPSEGLEEQTPQYSALGVLLHRVGMEGQVPNPASPTCDAHPSPRP